MSVDGQVLVDCGQAVRTFGRGVVHGREGIGAARRELDRTSPGCVLDRADELTDIAAGTDGRGGCVGEDWTIRRRECRSFRRLARCTRRSVERRVGGCRRRYRRWGAAWYWRGRRRGARRIGWGGRRCGRHAIELERADVTRATRSAVA